jgi:hypothetical protein
MVRISVLEILTEEVKKLYEVPVYQWTDGTVTENDRKILKEEAEKESPFDKLNLKRNLYNSLNNGNANIIVKETSAARVVILRENTSQHNYPWETWARVFQWFGNPKDNKIWQVYLYSSDVKRILPSKGEVVGPEHLNGGYTYSCSPDCIVIYRYEEATRVLIHELLHAACTDDNNKSVEFKEAATETWAELFLVTLLSKGYIKKTNNSKNAKVEDAYYIWNIQDHYIQDLNHTLKTLYNVKTPQDYASRYTTLREDVFKQFGIQLDPKYSPKVIESSRFTSAELDKYLK